MSNKTYGTTNERGKFEVHYKFKKNVFHKLRTQNKKIKILGTGNEIICTPK